MADKTGIEWTEATWNPVTGCSKVSPGCAHCYAETVTARYAGRKGWIEEHRPWTPENAEHNVRLRPERLDQPLRWQRPRMIFVNSMSDLFHEEIPDDFILEVFVTMALAHEHRFQVLTKRPERMRDVMTMVEAELWSAIDARVEVTRGLHQRAYVGSAAYHRAAWPLANVWLGVSIENSRYTWRADVLRDVPAEVRFISAEPLLASLFERSTVVGPPETAPVGRKPLDLSGIDWLIVGGESGGKESRPMRLEWARELRDACLAEGERRFEQSASCPVPVECEHGYDVCPICDARPAFFFKQYGSWVPHIGHVKTGDEGRLYVLTAAGPEPWYGMKHGACTVWGEPAISGHGDPIYRYVGVSPKSGGKMLDGREWCEMPGPKLPALV